MVTIISVSLLTFTKPSYPSIPLSFLDALPCLEDHFDL